MLLSIYLLVWYTLGFAASFTIKVPSEPVLVVRGATALLPCEFMPDKDLSQLVITWQREEDQRVVHSYYYQRDQLDKQDRNYSKRTRLNHQHITEGNASLALTDFRMKDAGKYLCIVTNSLGSERGVVQLVYGALYSEPRLSIHLSSNNATIRYETEGYPKPEVEWQGSGGQNLTYVQNASDEGLYHLRCIYKIQTSAFNITFTLKNPAVHQELQRHVVLIYDGNTDGSVNKSVVFLAILCVFLMCSTGVLLWLYFRKKENPHEKQNGHIPLVGFRDGLQKEEEEPGAGADMPLSIPAMDIEKSYEVNKEESNGNGTGHI
ncbi:V-set domain-containing T-cell activation inhibitor 1 isoform X2 [Misgurnus anguillicaudatus]|uniref:V-set domain-containing T-cell activation inhibitor 1 isoform X2 n=1 Tax=Misgurnus anguillicaudatus TaxID=75329 RepID=UPI003CCF88F1